jgi:hypothetical protein
MKKMILLMALLAISAISFSQQISKAKDESNAEKFSARAGSLIQKEFIDIATLKKCLIQVAKFTDLIAGQKSSAIRFEFEYRGYNTVDTKIAMLDEDEIDGLVKSIQLIIEKVLPSKATNYTEVNFLSRSGFSAGCFSKKDSWTTYLKLERYDSNSYVFMEKDDLTQLLSILNQAKTKM